MSNEISIARVLSSPMRIAFALMLSACPSPRRVVPTESAPEDVAIPPSSSTASREGVTDGTLVSSVAPVLACPPSQYVAAGACYDTLAKACAALGCSECQFNERAPMLVSCVR